MCESNFLFTYFLFIFFIFLGNKSQVISVPIDGNLISSEGRLQWRLPNVWEQMRKAIEKVNKQTVKNAQNIQNALKKLQPGYKLSNICNNHHNNNFSAKIRITVLPDQASYWSS